MKKLLTSCLIFCVSLLTTEAQIKLPAVFSDHTVLQQKSEVALWGWAGPSESLTITTSWDRDQVIKLKVPNMGAWQTTLKTPAAGGPFTITIKGYTEVIINDVMIGEVWICSGQSNMEFSVNNGVADAKEDLPNSNIPNIRLLQVTKSASETQQEHGDGTWQLCTPETMKSFSSVGYFFGKKLQSDLKVPIGLINISWGGTPAEVWTPKEKIEADPQLKAAADRIKKDYEWWPGSPGVVYNSMVRPLVPFGIAGVIWYQGEANTGGQDTYKRLMQTLIESWRSDFKKDFPFYYVQIAPYKYGRPYEGVLVRDQQSKLLDVPRTGMVVISDHVDNVEDIHPKFKKPVGDRLANYALAENYKRPILGYQSPVFKSMTVERNKAKIFFKYAEIGLISHNGDPTQFMIAGEDKKFYPATAKIDGGVVVVWAKEVKVPVAVRFCWDNTSFPNLFNKEGLPVSSFRTDDWDL